MTGPGRDSGAGTVLVLGVCGALVVMLAATAVLLAALVARHRAQAAADLAALAAADVVLGRRTGSACDAAASVAGMNGARLEACDVSDGVSAVVLVSVQPTGLAGTLGQARVAARAGPAP